MNRKIALLLVVIVLALLGIGGYVVVNRSGEKVEDSENLTKALEENNTSTNSLEETKEEQTNPNENAQTQTNPDETTSRNIAVVYFSATGNTKQVAEYIQHATNASIFEIIPTKAYTSDDLTWSNSDSRATKEQNDKSARPEIQNEIELSSYDVVFLGYPIWWGDTPRIIQTFVEKGTLNGKTVIPFCTSGSSSISGSESTLKEYSSINWISGKRLTTSKKEVEDWVSSLKY